MTAARKRMIAIINQLSDLARNGWRDALPCDYQPLEAELRVLQSRQKEPTP
jgi:hypothetical protein